MEAKSNFTSENKRKEDEMMEVSSTSTAQNTIQSLNEEQQEEQFSREMFDREEEEKQKKKIAEDQQLDEEFKKRYEQIHSLQVSLPENRRLTHNLKVQEQKNKLKKGDDELGEVRGYLQKKSPRLFGGWQNRYVVISQKKLSYFVKEGDSQPKGVINFALYSASICSIDKVTFKIELNGSNRQFLFKAHTEEIATEWVHEIGKHIKGAQEGMKITSLNRTQGFWKFDTLTEQQFISMADTADILLFRCKQFGSKLTRTVTGSHFDHVAVVLKFETDPDEVYYIEATSNRGVAISKWSAIKPFVGTFYEHIVLRHILVDRSDEMIDKLEIFLREAVGNKYGLNTSKLFFQRNTIKPKSAVFIDDDRTFFCSELVAKAYKVLGIIEDDGKSCALYYPSSFSTERSSIDLKLVEGAILGPELLIQYDLSQSSSSK